VSDSRSALLRAAAEEFAQQGLKGTRVSAIVRRSGVNERMIYHHFGSKDGLYLAVVADQREGIGEAWQPRLAEALTLPPYDGMRLALTALLETFRQRPLLLALLAHEWLSGAAVAPFPTADALPAQLRTIYDRGQRDGTFPAQVPFELAYGVAVGSIVAHCLFGARFMEATTPDHSPEAKTADVAIGQLMDGMTGPAPRD